MKLGDLIADGAIVPQLAGTDRDAVIGELVDALVETKTVPAEARDEVIEQIVAREKRGSTGFGKGVAVPHVKSDHLSKRAAAVGISNEGVDFNALDKRKVYSIVMLLSPASDPDNHLHAMERIFHHLQNETFRRFLRQATTRQEVEELIGEADAEQLQT